MNVAPTPDMRANAKLLPGKEPRHWEPSTVEQDILVGDLTGYRYGDVSWMAPEKYNGYARVSAYVNVVGGASVLPLIDRYRQWHEYNEEIVSLAKEWVEQSANFAWRNEVVLEKPATFDELVEADEGGMFVLGLMVLALVALGYLIGAVA